MYDDITHFIMYFFLGLVTMRSYYKNNHMTATIILITAFLLPILTEYFQYYVPKRAPDILDLYSDYLGLFSSIIGFLLYRYVKKIIN